jgi:hypothetical protein
MPLPNMPPSPGPGSYEVVNYDGTPKHYMSSAAFVSTTSRWTGDLSNPAEQPGPGWYGLDDEHNSGLVLITI